MRGCTKREDYIRERNERPSVAMENADVLNQIRRSNNEAILRRGKSGRGERERERGFREGGELPGEDFTSG